MKTVHLKCRKRDGVIEICWIFMLSMQMACGNSDGAQWTANFAGQNGSGQSSNNEERDSNEHDFATDDERSLEQQRSRDLEEPPRDGDAINPRWVDNAPEDVPRQTLLTREVISIIIDRNIGEVLGPLDDPFLPIQQALEWLTNDNDATTNQVGRMMGETRPWLLRWFPRLELVKQELDRLDASVEGLPRRNDVRQEPIDDWYYATLNKLNLPRTINVPQIPADDHQRIHPGDEDATQMGSRNLIIELPPESE